MRTGNQTECGKLIEMPEPSRSRKGSPEVFLYAFDVLELDGRDVRAQSWEARRALLTQLLNRCQEGLRLSDHIADTDGGSSSDKYMSWGLRGSSPSDAITRRGSRSRRQNLRLDKSGPDQVARTNCRGLENAPDAVRMLFGPNKIGKLLLKVSDQGS
jgi:hypothetical protein